MKFKQCIIQLFGLLLVVVVVIGVSTRTAQASFLGTVADYAVGGVLLPTLNAALGILSYLALTISSFFLSLAGTILNVGMYLTTHLGMFIDKTPVIYKVWETIRDLSSILLIFFILYAAIQMIVGLKQANYGELIKNIIIVGIFINFSFFFVRVMIDLSNIVSLEFYNAMAPSSIAVMPDKNGHVDISTLTSALIKSKDGGMSGALVGALNINQWFKNNLDDFGSTKATVAKSGSNTLNIILVSIGGIVVVGITTLNIIAAAAVAIIRMIMLIFLLAFSPIWVASWGMPALKEFSKTWTGQFYAQLIFLPVYLAFLYVALRIVTESKLNSVTTAADSTSIANVLNLFVGFGIVIVMLTIPMIAALAVTKALGGNSGIIEKWSNTARSWVGKNTYGRAAARINESNVMRNMYANNPRLGRAVSSGFSKISSNSFSADKKDKNKGFDQVRKGQIEDRTKFISGLGYDDQRVKDQKESYQKDEISKYNADLLTRTNSIEQIKNRIAHTSDPEAKAKYEKLLEQRTKELNTLRENRDKTIKEKTDVEEKRLKDERKETATKVYEKKSFGMGPSKFNKAVAASVRKGKMPADEIMEALKKLKDNEEKSGDKDKGGGSKDEDKKGK